MATSHKHNVTPMNIIRKIILFDFKIKGLSVSLIALFQIIMLLFFCCVIIYFSFNHDWKRWISFVLFIAVIKVTFDLSLLIVNKIKKSQYALADIVSLSNYNKNSFSKEASYLLGFTLVVIIAFLSSLLFLAYNFLDQDLQQNGLYTKGEVEKVYWRDFKKKSESGYYLNYSYKIDGNKIGHRTRLESKIKPKSIKIKYLSYLPQKHKIELNYTANTK
jgi:hypothetical protein